MRHSFLLILAVTLLLLTTSMVSAQHPTSEAGPAQNVPTRPRLRSEINAKITDEVVRAGDQFVIFRSGENVLIPLTPAALLKLGLDAHFSTNKLKEGVIITRILEIRAPIFSPFNAIYADKGMQVETVFFGRSSGFKTRAVLAIVPMQLQVEIGPGDYKVIEKLNGTYVALKPGKWRFYLQCSLTQVVSPEGDTWVVGPHSETDSIEGKAWGRDGRETYYPDPFAPLVGVPFVGRFSPFVELKGLVKMIFHRPNITLPTESDIYFHINRMTGTYLGPSIPTNPATLNR